MRYLIVLILTLAASYAYAQGGAFARYYIVADVQGGVWRLDTANGDLIKCRASDTMQCVKGR